MPSWAAFFSSVVFRINQLQQGFVVKVKKNKTQVIREHLLSLPPSRRSPTAVAKELKAKGCRVTRGHVSVVKSTMGNRKPDPTGRRLLLAKKFLGEVGGSAEARRLIAIVSRIMN
jgi:hypothetical protein